MISLLFWSGTTDNLEFNETKSDISFEIAFGIPLFKIELLPGSDKTTGRLVISKSSELVFKEL